MVTLGSPSASEAGRNRVTWSRSGTPHLLSRRVRARFAGSPPVNPTRFQPRLYQEERRLLVGDVITFSDVPGTEHGAQGHTRSGARWSASAAAFTAWRDGDQAALEELVRLLSPTLWQVVRATGLDRASAEDIVQNTWLALVDNAAKIENPMAVAGWLCTTARRDAWRVSKKIRREIATDDDVLGSALPSVDGPEDDLVLADDKARLRRCLSRVSDRCQALLRMLAAGPRPDYAEVSDAMDMPVGSIGPTRARCLEKLRIELVAEGAA